MRFLFAVALLLGSMGLAHSGEAAGPAQKHCPISGKSVDGSVFVDVEGFRVMVAGQIEADAVRKKPGDAFKALAKRREAAEPVVWLCPSMEQAVDRRYPFVQQAGKRIYYCCRPCQPRIKNDFKWACDKMKSFAGQ